MNLKSSAGDNVKNTDSDREIISLLEYFTKAPSNLEYDSDDLNDEDSSSQESYKEVEPNPVCVELNTVVMVITESIAFRLWTEKKIYSSTSTSRRRHDLKRVRFRLAKSVPIFINLSWHYYTLL